MNSQAEEKVYDSCLSVEEVERISGLHNVRLKSFHPMELLGSHLNFVTESGNKILCIDFLRANQYWTYKTIVPGNNTVPLHGVGEEAFAGYYDTVNKPVMLIFRKGSHAVFLTTSSNRDIPRGILNLNQLIALGKLVASRIE
jgi:hypothetical protein